MILSSAKVHLVIQRDKVEVPVKFCEVEVRIEFQAKVPSYVNLELRKAFRARRKSSPVGNPNPERSRPSKVPKSEPEEVSGSEGVRNSARVRI